MQLPLTNQDITKTLGRPVGSPILISNLQELKLEQAALLEFFSPLFSELSWDYYDVKRLQVEFLIKAFPEATQKINAILKDYYTGKTDIQILQPWINKLSIEDRYTFDKILPWRRRSVCQFIYNSNPACIIRKKVPQFSQAVESNDLRSWPRIFEESPAAHVQNHLFYNLLLAVKNIVQAVSKQPVNKLEITAHFMSVMARPEQPGDNSPEGAHEDGADFIISALVINRINLTGGESQIIELRDNNKKEIIARHILQPGEFVFQADSKDELVYGTDLWHHVTLFHKTNERGPDAWRDIIGFDINII